MRNFYRHHKYQTECMSCGRFTTKRHARENHGLCKQCVDGGPDPTSPIREERILEHGYQAYAREEGHYDQGDN